MQTAKILIIGMILTVLAACTPMIYGVPQERWDLMSEQERIVAMEAYKERQIAYQQASAERARIRAEQEAFQQAQLEEEMRRRQDSVDLIYRGRAGSFGDLLEVTLYDGQIRLNGKKRGYSPVTFKIAEGEIKAIPIYFSKGRKNDLFVMYENRHLWFDTGPYGQNTGRAGHLIFNNEWRNGITYNSLNSHGSRDMRGVSVNIDVLPIRRGRGYGRQQPKVIIKEKIIIKEKVVQAPPKVIVKEKVVQAPPKVIIKEKIVQAPPQVIIKEKTVNKPTKVIVKDKQHQKVIVEKQNKYSKTEYAKKDKSERPDKRQRKEHKRKAEQPEKETIHVELNGGKILIGGRHRPFKPVNFRIAEGESRTVEIVGKNNIKQELTVSYQNGQLYFDGHPEGKKTRAIRADKSKSIEISTKGKAKLYNVQVDVTR